MKQFISTLVILLTFYFVSAQQAPKPLEPGEWFKANKTFNGVPGNLKIGDEGTTMGYLFTCMVSKDPYTEWLTGTPYLNTNGPSPLPIYVIVNGGYEEVQSMLQTGPSYDAAWENLCVKKQKGYKIPDGKGWTFVYTHPMTVHMKWRVVANPQTGTPSVQYASFMPQN